MRRTLLFMCAILLVAGCVSNKAFKEQQNKAVILEQRQNKQDTALEVLRKDLLKEKENIEQIVIRLNNVDKELLVIDDIQTELAATGDDIYMLEDEVLSLKEELANALDRSAALEQSIADMRAETAGELAAMRESVSEEINVLSMDMDDSFDAFADEFAEIRDNMSGYATLEDMDNISMNLVTQDDLDYAIEDFVTREEIANLKPGTGVSGGNDEYAYMLERLQSDVDNLRDVVTDLQSDLYSSGLVGSDQLEAKMNQEADNRRDQLTQLRKRVDDLETEVSGKLSAESGTRNETLTGLTARLNNVDDALNQLRTDMSKQGTKTQQELDTIKSRMDKIATDLNSINADISPVLSQDRVKRAKAQDLAASAQYKAALAQYNYGNYDDAIVMFEDFIDANPNNDLIPNAWYWIGECYYSGKKWPSALNNFQHVVDNFSGHKVNDSRLKIAMTYYYMGRTDEAYNELMILKNMTPRYDHIDLVDKFLRLVSK